MILEMSLELTEDNRLEPRKILDKAAHPAANPP
jgi:hypothetical protein